MTGLSRGLLRAMAFCGLLIIGCEPLEGKGDPTKKILDVQIKADKEVIKPGETITLTSTITNRSQKPLNVPLGYSHAGVNYKNGSFYQMMAGEKKEVIKPQWRVGFCGTGSYPLYVAIQPGKSLSYTCTVQLKQDKEGWYLNLGSTTNDWIIARIPKGEKKVLLRTEQIAKPLKQALTIPTFAPKQFNPTTGWAPDLLAPVWHGTLQSNTISIQTEVE